MAVAQSAIAAAAGKHDDLRGICAEANRTLCEANPLGMFVTGVIAMIDTTTGRLEYVCAGHEPPLAVGPGKQLSRLGATDNIPLGLEPAEQYNKLKHEIACDETIVAYTDGVTDACNPEDELFGESRLQELLANNALEPPQRMLQQIMDGSRPVLGADGRSRRHDVRAGQARRLKPGLPPPAPGVRPRVSDIGAATATDHEGGVRTGDNGTDQDRIGGPSGRHAAGLRPRLPRTNGRSRAKAPRGRAAAQSVQAAHGRYPAPGRRTAMR